MENCDLERCIDRALDDFGSSVKQNVYFTMLMNSGLRYDDIVKNPEEFVHSLGQAFVDEESSKSARRAIVREISAVFNLISLRGSSDVAKAIRMAGDHVAGLSGLDVCDTSDVR